MNDDEMRELARKEAAKIGKSQEYEEMRKRAHLMGVLWGVLKGYELVGKPVDYGEVEMLMSQYCSEQELKKIARDVKHYSRLIDGLL